MKEWCERYYRALMLAYMLLEVLLLGYLCVLESLSYWGKR